MTSKANTIFTVIIMFFAAICLFAITLFAMQSQKTSKMQSQIETTLEDSKEFCIKSQELESNMGELKREMKVRKTGINTKLERFEDAIEILQKIDIQKKIISDPTHASISNRGLSRSVLKLKGTAYDLSFESCEKERDHPLYGITASGVRATQGRTVAVDPKVIPLGSILYVVFPKPYEYLNGYRVAEDVGGAIKGNRIDIFMGEDKPGETTISKIVDRFGVQWLHVYVINKEAMAKEQKELDELYKKLNKLTGG